MDILADGFGSMPYIYSLVDYRQPCICVGAICSCEFHIYGSPNGISKEKSGRIQFPSVCL